MRSINLLPPEVFKTAAAHRRRNIWILAGLVYLLVLGAVSLWQFRRVSKAEDEVAAQQQINAGLQTEVVGLAGVETTKRAFEQTAVAVETALGNDIAWAGILTDLGLQISDNVWLASFAGASSGEVSMTGVGLSYRDVANWLRTLGGETFTQLGGGWMDNLQTSQIGNTPTVNFSATSFLTELARSARASTRIPEVAP